MSQVTVTIDGKAYRMACDEGQEKYLMDLARRFDLHIAQLRSSFGEIGDQRLTVMAGIMLTDELTELQKRIKGLESEIGTLRKIHSESLAKFEKNEESLAHMVSDLLKRIENLSGEVLSSSG